MWVVLNNPNTTWIYSWGNTCENGSYQTRSDPSSLTVPFILQTASYMFSLFSTRELALVLWLFILICLSISNRNIRNSFLAFLSHLFNFKIVSILFLFIGYIFGMLIILSKFNLWYFALLKDTFFWFFSIAIALLFGIGKAGESGFFKRIFIESIKWTIVIEFIINFFTFNFWIEIFLVPLIFVLALTHAISETNKKYLLVGNMIQNILGVIGLLFICYSFYKTISEYKDFFIIKNLLSFLLPPIMTLLIIPYLYFLALYMQYETFFVRTELFISDKKEKTRIKKEVIMSANFNLHHLNQICKKFNKSDLYQSADIGKYIKSLIH